MSRSARLAWPARRACLAGVAVALEETYDAPLMGGASVAGTAAGAQLGEEAFAAAWQAGHAMPLAEAIAWALGVAAGPGS